MTAPSLGVLRDKRNLRRELKRRIGGLPPETFHAEGVKAAALLRSLPLWRTYQTILVFYSMKDEIDTGPLIAAAFAGGKAVFAPKIQGDRMRFWRVYPPPRFRGGGGRPRPLWYLGTGGASRRGPDGGGFPRPDHHPGAGL